NSPLGTLMLGGRHLASSLTGQQGGRSVGAANRDGQPGVIPNVIDVRESHRVIGKDCAVRDARVAAEPIVVDLDSCHRRFRLDNQVHGAVATVGVVAGEVQVGDGTEILVGLHGGIAVGRDVEGVAGDVQILPDEDLDAIVVRRIPMLVRSVRPEGKVVNVGVGDRDVVAGDLRTIGGAMNVVAQRRVFGAANAVDLH